MNRRRFLVLSMAMASAGAQTARGQSTGGTVKIGVTVSATGPAASLGIPEKNAVALMPQTIGGQSVQYIVLDDASDPTAARRNAEKLVNESSVDLIIGSSTTPASLAMVEVAGKSKTPMIALGAGRTIIHPVDDNRRWVFKTPYNDATLALATAKHMVSVGVKTVAIIAFNDAYGESWVNEFNPVARDAGLTVVASEKYNRNDTSVTAQVLKIVSTNPDAVLIVAAGTPGALPQTTLAERAYKGRVYQTTGIVNNDFLRVGGKAVEGTLIVAAPLVVATQLAADHPAKRVAVELWTKYEAAHGVGSVSAFVGYAWDAFLIAQAGIDRTLKKAKPGTAEFRAALRDALEASSGLATTAGLVTMSADDHNGYAPTAPVIISVTNGAWTVAKT